VTDELVTHYEILLKDGDTKGIITTRVEPHYTLREAKKRLQGAISRVSRKNVVWAGIKAHPSGRIVVRGDKDKDGKWTWSTPDPNKQPENETLL
jgi:hypothetical protein